MTEIFTRAIGFSEKPLSWESALEWETRIRGIEEVKLGEVLSELAHAGYTCQELSHERLILRKVPSDELKILLENNPEMIRKIIYYEQCPATNETIIAIQ